MKACNALVDGKVVMESRLHIHQSQNERHHRWTYFIAKRSFHRDGRPTDSRRSLSARSRTEEACAVTKTCIAPRSCSRTLSSFLERNKVWESFPTSFNNFSQIRVFSMEHNRAVKRAHRDSKVGTVPRSATKQPWRRRPQSCSPTLP